MDDFKRGNSDLQEGMHILLTQTGIDVTMLPTIGIANYVEDCVYDYEGVPIPPEWHSRYNTLWNLIALIAEMCNIMKCNRECSCIP